MFNKSTWSTRKLSWFYAVIIALLIAFGSFLLIRRGVIEIFDVRIVYVFFILLGTLAFSMDLAKQSREPIPFIRAFKYCFRTGVFMSTVLFSIGILTIITVPNINIMERGGSISKESGQLGYFFSMVIEIFATILISSFVSAFIPGMAHKRK